MRTTRPLALAALIALTAACGSKADNKPAITAAPPVSVAASAPGASPTATTTPSSTATLAPIQAAASNEIDVTNQLGTMPQEQIMMSESIPTYFNDQLRKTPEGTMYYSGFKTETGGGFTVHMLDEKQTVFTLPESFDQAGDKSYGEWIVGPGGILYGVRGTASAREIVAVPTTGSRNSQIVASTPIPDKYITGTTDSCYPVGNGFACGSQSNSELLMSWVDADGKPTKATFDGVFEDLAEKYSMETAKASIEPGTNASDEPVTVTTRTGKSVTYRNLLSAWGSGTGVASFSTAVIGTRDCVFGGVAWEQPDSLSFVTCVDGAGTVTSHGIVSGRAAYDNGFIYELIDGHTQTFLARRPI
jgi:hypothetical protein